MYIREETVNALFDIIRQRYGSLQAKAVHFVETIKIDNVPLRMALSGMMSSFEQAYPGIHPIALNNIMASTAAVVFDLCKATAEIVDLECQEIINTENENENAA